MATLNVEASIPVEASQVAHYVVFEGGLVVLRLPVVQVLQPVARQQLLVRFLIVLGDWMVIKGQHLVRDQYLVSLEVQHSRFEILAGSGRGGFEPRDQNFNASHLNVENKSVGAF